MFTTIYLRYKGFEIDKHLVVSKHESLNLKGDARFDRELKTGIKSGKYSVVRVIIDKVLVDNSIEYYIYDFNGKSFIILDKLGTNRSVPEIIDWIETVLYMAKNSKIYEGLTVININSNNFLTSRPNDAQTFYHEFGCERAIKYFKSFNRIRLYT